MNTLLESALDVARRRHTLIAAGEAEAYGELEDALREACDRVAGPPAPPLEPADLPALDELIALETRSAELLAGMMEAVSVRMATLRHSGHANGAYARSEHFSVNGR